MYLDLGYPSSIHVPASDFVLAQNLLEHVAEKNILTKGDKMTGDFRKLHIDKLHNLCSS